MSRTRMRWFKYSDTEIAVLGAGCYNAVSVGIEYWRDVVR